MTAEPGIGSRNYKNGLAQSTMKPRLVLRGDRAWLRCRPDYVALSGLPAAYAVVVGSAFVAAGFNVSLSPLVLAIMALVTVLPTILLMRPLCTRGLVARLTAKEVRVTLLPRCSLGAEHWVEPSSAYRCLYIGEEQESDGPVRAHGTLVLEHASEPGRSLLLVRQSGEPINPAFAQEVAVTLGLPLHRTS